MFITASAFREEDFQRFTRKTCGEAGREGAHPGIQLRKREAEGAAKGRTTGAHGSRIDLYRTATRLSAVASSLPSPSIASSFPHKKSQRQSGAHTRPLAVHVSRKEHAPTESTFRTTRLIAVLPKAGSRARGTTVSSASNNIQWRCSQKSGSTNLDLASKHI
jgi:hypothetical protein